MDVTLDVPLWICRTSDMDGWYRGCDETCMLERCVDVTLDVPLWIFHTTHVALARQMRVRAPLPAEAAPNERVMGHGDATDSHAT